MVGIQTKLRTMYYEMIYDNHRHSYYTQQFHGAFTHLGNLGRISILSNCNSFIIHLFTIVLNSKTIKVQCANLIKFYPSYKKHIFHALWLLDPP